MIRLALFLAAAAILVTACASDPAPVERRGDAAPIERRVAGASLGTSSAQTSVPQAPQSVAGEIVVTPGATLYQIAETNQVSLRALINANRLEPPYSLSTGQRLMLPETDTYVVRRGDTLNSIARRHSIQPRSLALLNGLEDEDSIAVGQVLRLPGPARRGFFDFGRPDDAPPAAAPARTASRGGVAGFAWPLRGAIIDGFGPKAAGARNDGVNIAARDGEPVLAAADGLVVFSDSLEGYGQLILVKHDDGWVSAYAHNRRLLVAEEQTVTQGQQIAEAGSTGAVDAPQLHFELRRDGSPIDPLTALPG